MTLKITTALFVLFYTFITTSAFAESVKGSITNLIPDDEGVKVVMVNKKTNEVRSTYLRNTHPEFIKLRDMLLDSQKNKKPIQIETATNSSTDIQTTTLLKPVKK